jgi:two-component system, OmpR family, phosphate regulon response regulator PhoB
MGARILVVEDSAAIRRLIEICLRGDDLEIITREDGPSGLEAVTTESPDLVVLDIALPGMDGWRVLDAIRSKPETRDIPVLVLTAYGEGDTRRRRDQGGADSYIAKPFEPPEFREKVYELIARKPD